MSSHPHQLKYKMSPAFTQSVVKLIQFKKKTALWLCLWQFLVVLKWKVDVWDEGNGNRMFLHLMQSSLCRSFGHVLNRKQKKMKTRGRRMEEAEWCVHVQCVSLMPLIPSVTRTTGTCPGYRLSISGPDSSPHWHMWSLKMLLWIVWVFPICMCK